MFNNCIIESQNHLGWKRPLRPSSPTINPSPPCLLNHMLKCHIYTPSEHLQGWWSHHLPGQPVPMLDHSFSKEIFPNIQPKPPLTQLEAISSRPISSCFGEETNTCLTTTSFEVAVASGKVSPQSPLLQTKSQLPQPLLIFLRLTYQLLLAQNLLCLSLFT